MSGTCGNCGGSVSPGEAFCGACGQPVAQTSTTVMAAAMQSSIPLPRPAGNWPAVSPDAGLIPPSIDDSSMAAAAVGQATPNAQYLGHRLTYDTQLEVSFDPLGSQRLLVQFGMHALVYWAVYTLGAWLSGFALLIVGYIGLGFTAAATLWVVGAALFGLAFLCLFWLIPVPVQLSEWKFFVDGKASVASVAFDHIAWALQQRQTPLEMVQVRRLSLAGGESRDYLEIRRGLFTGMISCFAYGRDLYLGWTFWFKLSPLGYLLMYCSRIWQILTRHGSDMYVRLRYDYARAMRESMHSAAREGVDAAIGRARPQGQGLSASLQVQVADVSAQ